VNQEIKAAWVAALRSGEFEQGRGALFGPDDQGNPSYCCLGVLSKLAVDAGIVEMDPTSRIGNGCHRFGRSGSDGFLGTYSYLPVDVQHWAGVDGDPEVTIDEKTMYLSQHNDMGATFTQIADAIEAQP
jgi:hypothetical protein